MIKQVIRNPARSPDRNWLDTSAIALVELTSEHPDHPIEQALQAGAAGSWRAGSAGPQTIRLVFNEAQNVRKIRLSFQETASRTHEFCLSWAEAVEQRLRTIVRQQWTFSPEGSTSEREEYEVNLERISVLQLSITPDIAGTDAVAAIEEFLVGT
jgi:hypothetical protein